MELRICSIRKPKMCYMKNVDGFFICWVKMVRNGGFTDNQTKTTKINMLHGVLVSCSLAFCMIEPILMHVHPLWQLYAHVNKLKFENTQIRLLKNIGLWKVRFL